MSDKFMLPWATPEDASRAITDFSVYGTVYVKRDADGLAHRVDPKSIVVSAAPCPECQGRGYVQNIETGDYGNGQGWGNLTVTPCSRGCRLITVHQ